MKGFKPGQAAPASGQYKTIGPRGGQGKEITSTKGNTLPPAPTPGSTYKLVDATKNKSGK
jgi:putative alpha-1,2-mannosidase